MGVVYKACKQSTGQVVALKVLDPELAADARFIERFLGEARHAAKLKQHANVVEAYDFGADLKYFYFAMELVEGRSLAQIIYNHGKLAERQSLTIVKQVAQALDHIHQSSIIHRDIKPENIMISKAGIVKVCDLGLAKDLSSNVSRTVPGTRLGTMDYASPEQALGQSNLDIRTDIYSLGICLYHMLVGELPFEGSKPVEAAIRHIEGNLPSLRAKTPSISPNTETLYQRMTAKDREKRYPHPQALLSDVSHVLMGEPLSPLAPPEKPKRVKEKSVSTAGGHSSSGSSKSKGTKTLQKRKRHPNQRLTYLMLGVTVFLVILLLWVLYLYQ